MIENYKASDYINENVYSKLKCDLEKIELEDSMEGRKHAFKIMGENIETTEFNCDVKEIIKRNLNSLNNI